VAIYLKRAYVAPSPTDGTRVLVERLWPRGLSKERARVDAWFKDVAPSTELRRWFGHDDARWEEFRRRYRDELGRRDDELAPLRELVDAGQVTFVYGSREQEHNAAAVLKEYLESEHAGGRERASA
jgi:uncharacterized protein YeaO (DUF488 family)